MGSQRKRQPNQRRQATRRQARRDTVPDKPKDTEVSPTELDATTAHEPGHLDQTGPSGLREPASSVGKDQTLPEREVLGDFRLIKKLGQGGMGLVYKAHQISMDRQVALKLLSPELASQEELVTRFYREARAMARLDHPNIVRGYAVGEVDGQHYVAMEYVNGVTLQQILTKRRRLSVGDAVHVVLVAAEALQHAHENNMVHRDVKPDNILVTRDGVVKVADLGLAKAQDDNLSLTQSGAGFGTPYFMPLEQYRDAKHADARSDIYALGVTLYCLLTGKLPFEGESHAQVIEAKQTARVTPVRRLNPAVSERLDLVVEKMMAREPEQRYQSCAELIRDLEFEGVASEFLSFCGPSAVRRKPGLDAPQLTPQEATEQIEPTTGSGLSRRDIWIVYYEDRHGQASKKKISTGRLKQLITQDKLDVTTTRVKRLGEASPRPLNSYAEFDKLVLARSLKAKADRHGAKMSEFYEKVGRAERRRKLFRKLRSLASGTASLLLLLAMLAAIAAGGYLLYINWDSIARRF